MLKWKYSIRDHLYACDKFIPKKLYVTNAGDVLALIECNGDPLVLYLDKNKRFWTKVGEYRDLEVAGSVGWIYLLLKDGSIEVLDAYGNEKWKEWFWLKGLDISISNDGTVLGITGVNLSADTSDVIVVNRKIVMNRTRKKEQIWFVGSDKTKPLRRVSVSANGKYVGFFSLTLGNKPVVRVYSSSGKLIWEWLGNERLGIIDDMKIITLNDSSAIIGYHYITHHSIHINTGKITWSGESKLLDASPDGNLIVVTEDSFHSKIILGRNDRETIEYSTSWNSANVSENGFIVAGDYRGIYLINSKGKINERHNLRDEISQVSISPNGRYYVALSKKGILYFFEKKYVESKSGNHITNVKKSQEKKKTEIILESAQVKSNNVSKTSNELVSQMTPLILEVQSPNELPYSSSSLIKLRITSSSLVENPELDLSYLTYYFDILWRGQKLSTPKLQLPPLLPGVTLEEELTIKPKYKGTFPLKLTLIAGKGRVERTLTLKVVSSPAGAGVKRDVPSLDRYYELIYSIGEGGFAKVYRAKRKKDGELVALKVPKKVDRYVGKLFVREIKAWELVNDHRNVVKLLDYSISPIYIEMELCDYSLYDLLENGPLSPEKVASIIIPILDVLEYAHSKGVIHRDIKPSNILFKSNTPKLGDWGIAKVVESSGGLSITGTPQYKAPEQFSPNTYGHTDRRTDIWQVGVLMYEMLTGELPFGYDIEEVQYRIENKILPIKPSEINRVAWPFDGIIMKCLQFKKKRRFQSVTELKEAIAKAMPLATL